MPEIFSSDKPKGKQQKNELTGHHSRKVLYKDMPMQARRPFASFLVCPENVNFETKDHEEKVIMFLRKHFVTNIPWIFMVALMFLVPILVTNFSLFDGIPDNFMFVFIL